MRFLVFVSLQVVSTKVGGVPEVLPPDLIQLAEPSSKGKSSSLPQTTPMRWAFALLARWLFVW